MEICHLDIINYFKQSLPDQVLRQLFMVKDNHANLAYTYYVYWSSIKIRCRYFIILNPLM